MASDNVISMCGALAGGRYDGLMKAVWQQAAVTSSPPPAAVGLTLNADRLTLLASAPKAKAPSAIPYLSQARPPFPSPSHFNAACMQQGGWQRMVAAKVSSRLCLMWAKQAAYKLPTLRVMLPSGRWVC